MKTAVVAGTPIDTGMGVAYLNTAAPDVETVFHPLASCPRECHLFQLKGEEEKICEMAAFLEPVIIAGADNVFVYCNSLGASVDFPAVARRLGRKIVTPMSAYRQLARKYGSVGVLAANNQSTAGIESAFTAVRPDGYVFGYGNLRLVEAVENRMAPEEIVRSFKLPSVVEAFAAAGAEAVILGCTHFPYFAEALAELSPLPVIDPADIMLAELLSD